MTAKEIVSAVLQGRPTPRVPAGPLAVHFCAGIAGYTLHQYTTDARALADSVIRYYERFKPDAVWVSSDTWVSAEAMGARVAALDEFQPFGGVGEPLVRTASDIARIPAPDAGKGRYPVMLAALARIIEELGRDVFIVACFDQYPFSLAAALMGINEMMLKVVDDPPFVEDLMHRCAEYALTYARALGDIGADLLSGGDSPAGLLGPPLYLNLAQPAEKLLITAVKAATRKPVSLHICGNAMPILSGMKSSGADVLELDHAVDLGEACRIVGPDITLWGNIDPVGVLARGTPADVWTEVRRTLAAVTAHDHRRFVLSSGCTLAVETPVLNLQTMIAASASAGDSSETLPR